MQTVLDTFSDRLKETMLEKNMSQYALAKAVELPQATISRYVSGKREIGICNLCAICRALGVSSDVLLGLSDF